MGEKLMRCPFCGSKDVIIKELEYVTVRVLCRSCLAQGGRMATKEGAAEAWNTRALLPAVQEIKDHCSKTPDCDYCVLHDTKICVGCGVPAYWDLKT